LSHDLKDWKDERAVLDRLNCARPTCIEVEHYWARTGSDRANNDTFQSEAPPRYSDRYRYYSGPGFLIAMTPVAARIEAHARWSGFLSIPPLRAVHVQAFRAFAAAFDSPQMVVCSDAEDDLFDLTVRSGTQADCIEYLTRKLGAPNRISDLPEREVERFERLVWFLEQC
jgi:hypothetical protein